MELLIWKYLECLGLGVFLLWFFFSVPKCPLDLEVTAIANGPA